MAVSQGQPSVGPPISMLVDPQGRQVNQPDPTDALAPLLLEMRACRIGLELLNQLKPGDLLKLANKG